MKKTWLFLLMLGVFSFGLCSMQKNLRLDQFSAAFSAQSDRQNRNEHMISYSDFEFFFTVPAAIKKNLDEHADELSALLATYCSKSSVRRGCNVTKLKWLPGYYIKYGVERVFNAQKLKKIISKQSLKLLGIPNKYLYHVPGRPKVLSDENYLIIAQEIDGACGRGQCLGVNQVKQLCFLAEHAGYYDLHPANYVTAADGKVFIIDTDREAMPSQCEVDRLYKDWLLHGTRIHNGAGVIVNPSLVNHPLVKLELALYSKHRNYDDEAYTYLWKKCRDIEFRRKKLKLFNFLPDTMKIKMKRLNGFKAVVSRNSP